MKNALNFAANLLQFLPLTVFVVFSFRTGVPSQERLFHGFEIGAAVALFQLLWLQRQRTPTNRLILGANLWLITGGIAAFFQLWGVLKLFRELREAGVLVCMLVIGVFTTLFSPAGFAGSTSGTPPLIFRYSCILLVLTSLAVAWGFSFRGNMVWAAVVPIAVLAVVNRLINKKLNEKAQ